MFWDKLFRKKKEQKIIPDHNSWTEDEDDTDDEDDSEETQDSWELTGQLPRENDDSDFKILLEIVVTCQKAGTDR